MKRTILSFGAADVDGVAGVSNRLRRARSQQIAFSSSWDYGNGTPEGFPASTHGGVLHWAGLGGASIATRARTAA
jgi:hypothetical protein